MGIGKISGHRAESLYSGSGICYVRTSFIASSASRSAQASAISPSVQLIEAGEYCETLRLQLMPARLPGSRAHCPDEWHLECTVGGVLAG